MRKAGRWMTVVDDRVLEYLDEEEAGTPKEIRDDAGIPYTPEYVARRCRELADKGFIQKISAAPTYRITERGVAYLSGEFDARTLDEDNEAGNSGMNASAD